MKDKSIKISVETYKMLIGLKNKKKVPIKYLVESAVRTLLQEA